MLHTLVNILMVVGSISLFLFGMRWMSEALQKMAGGHLRRMVYNMTSTTAKQVSAGFFITMVLNSSSAITVMIVSFVNAGLLSLPQSMGMIMGANVGTTVTAWLISVFGFAFPIGMMAIPLIGIGFPLTLFKRESLRSAGNIIIGFALLFLAIDILNITVSGIEEGFLIDEDIALLSRHGIWSSLLFFAIGLVLTTLIQSSSATIVLTMIMCSHGWIPFECGAAMILGENLGTTITANVAASATNVDAKRAAFSHTLFNAVGVLWAIPLLGPMSELVSSVMTSLGGNSPLAVAAATPVGLSLFHTMFNLFNVLLLIGFIPLLVKLISRLIGDGGKSVVPERLLYINKGILSAGDLSIIQAQGELIKYANRSSKMFADVRKLFREHNNEVFNTIYSEIEAAESESDRTREELYDFLGKSTRENIGASSKRNIAIMFRLVSDIEIMSDSNYSIAKLIRTKKEHNIWFDPELRAGINQMFDLIERALMVMNHNLSSSTAGYRSMDEALEVERAISELRNRLREEALHTEGREESNHKADLIFSDLITRTEQLADIIVHISEDAMHLRGVNEK